MLHDKNLDEVVLDALDLHSSYKLPEYTFDNHARKLIIASGNALPTGMIIFRDDDVIFADEGQYAEVLEKESIHNAVVISASGKKHAPIIVKDLLRRDITTNLLTCNRNSDAAQLLNEKNVFETKSIDEPITYNTSSYLGMILAKTRENPLQIKDHISQYVHAAIPKNIGSFGCFYIMIPPEFEIAKEMFITKFDELFGGKIAGRCYTTEQTRHAKTVVPSKDELFISIGFKNDLFGYSSARMDVPLFSNAGYAAVIATGYYIIGKIQEQKYPFFMENAEQYAYQQKEVIFNQPLYETKVRRFIV